MDLQKILRRMHPDGGAAESGPAADVRMMDTAETVYISSLALLKMLKHGRAGVPLEVMGLMLGEFVDDYTVVVKDVFAMPQSGTGVSVEAVDPVFQTNMLDMLKRTGRPEAVVGWYHSHPGFGCWLSNVDVNTQQAFEQTNERCVAVVVDPIQSVRGKVVIDAFRTIQQRMGGPAREPRQVTSNLGHLVPPSIFAMVHGLNRHYYSMNVKYTRDELDQKMLLNVHRPAWNAGLALPKHASVHARNEQSLRDMARFAAAYQKSIQEEMDTPPEKLVLARAGKLDPKHHLYESALDAMGRNTSELLGAGLGALLVHHDELSDHESSS